MTSKQCSIVHSFDHQICKGVINYCTLSRTELEYGVRRKKHIESTTDDSSKLVGRHPVSDRKIRPLIIQIHDRLCAGALQIHGHLFCASQDPQ